MLFSIHQIQPIRLGHLWYLNVHDPTRGPHWISCDASLYSDRVVLSWEAEARGSRGFVTLDLIHCSGMFCLLPILENQDRLAYFTRQLV